MTPTQVLGLLVVATWMFCIIVGYHDSLKSLQPMAILPPLLVGFLLIIFG